MVFVGLHIHKTAGTSLLRYLETHAGERLYGSYSLRNLRRLEMPLWAYDNKGEKDIFWGHSIYESFFYGMTKPARLFTFLREPQQRIVSWYKMLHRRKKLKKNCTTLEEFAAKHSNSMSKMLVNRFPTLAGDKDQRLSQRALMVLEQMTFVGLQANFSEHLKLLLELMNVPVQKDLLLARHNTDKPKRGLDIGDVAFVDKFNEEDHLLYEEAARRYFDSPVSPDRNVTWSSGFGLNQTERENLLTVQRQAAQRKFISSLQYSIGDMALESHLEQMVSSYGSALELFHKKILRGSQDGDFE